MEQIKITFSNSEVFEMWIAASKRERFHQLCLTIFDKINISDADDEEKKKVRNKISALCSNIEKMWVAAGTRKER